MLEVIEMITEIVGKTKTILVKTQDIGEFCGIQPTTKWMERRRRKWDDM